MVFSKFSELDTEISFGRGVLFILKAFLLEGGLVHDFSQAFNE